jgi:PAS domain S-box-containing protein
LRAALPPNEPDRLRAVRRYQYESAGTEAGLDRLAKVASRLLKASTSLVTLVDQDWQFVKGNHGLRIPALPRDISFCQHTILSEDPMVVCDATMDARFADNPLVTENPGIRFYAGVPLINPDGFHLGALCVLDFVPRPAPSPEDLSALQELAAEAVAQMEFRNAQRDLMTVRDALDNSARELAESRRQWKKTDQRATLAMQSGRMGLWEWDATTNLISFSPLLERMLEYKSDEYTGTFACWLEHIHPDYRDLVTKEVSKARQTEEVSSFKYRVNMRDGSERWITTTGRHQFEEDGSFIGAQGVSWDSTAEVRAERELRMSEERFRSVLAASPVGVFLADLQGNVTYVNARAEAIHEMPEQEILGRGWVRSVHPDDLERCLSGWTAASAEGKAWETEFRMLLPDGSVRWVLTRSEILFDQQGRPASGVGILDDITDRRRAIHELSAAKDAAEVANRAKDLFLSNMSHELRTPLNGVLGMTDLLLETPLTEEQREMTEVIRFSGQSLLSVVNDLLDLSRIEAGQFAVENIPFRLPDVVREAVGLMQSEAHKKNLSLVESPATDTGSRYIGDPNAIRQVLMNYLSNAVKFSETGAITVEAKTVDRGADVVEVLLSVRDRGLGISPEAQSKLFQPFAQVDGSSTRHHGGAGLGLVICKRLAELMGGSVGVSSSLSQGSTFWLRLTLPKYVESVAECPAHLAESPAYTRSSRRAPDLSSHRP